MKYTWNTIKKRVMVIFCMFLTGILSACGTSGNTKSSASAELGIHAFGTTTISNRDQGHAFLSLKNTGNGTIDFLNYPLLPGEEITVGYWPGGGTDVDKRPKTGVYLNFDAIKDVRNQNGQHDVVSMRKNLTVGEIQKLIDFTKEFTGTDYESLTNNCTTYAVEAWNLVNDEKLIENTSFLNQVASVDAPKWTKEYIQKNIDDETMSVGTYDPDDNLDDFHVFMVNPDGSLIPYYVDLREYAAAVDEENTPCDIDVTWEKWGKELYDGTILMNQVRIIYMKKGADESDFTEARIDADKGGCVLADLDPGAVYLVKLCPLYEYSYKGKTQYVEGEWTDVMEVKVGELVKNNGGNVVGYKDNVYYWKYSGASFEPTGLFGHYLYDGNQENQLIRRSQEGSETILLTSKGNGSIFISGERIYLSYGNGELYSVDMDGKDRVEHGIFEPWGADGKNGHLIGRKGYDEGGGVTALEADHTKRVLSGQGYKSLGVIDGYCYFTHAEFQDTAEFVLYRVSLDGSELKEIDRVAKQPGASLGLDIYQLTELGDTLYYSYGFYSGTGGFFGGGGINCVDIDGTNGKVCVEYGDLTAEEFMVEEKDGQTLLYYISDEDATGSYVGYWDYPYNGCSVKNLSSGATEKSSFQLSSPGSFVCIGGDILLAGDNTTVYREAIPKEAGFGFTDIPSAEQDALVLIPRLDVVGDELYFTVDWSSRNPERDMGWRPGYVRNRSTFYTMKIGDKEAKELYSY